VRVLLAGANGACPGLVSEGEAREGEGGEEEWQQTTFVAPKPRPPAQRMKVKAREGNGREPTIRSIKVRRPKGGEMGRPKTTKKGGRGTSKKGLRLGVQAHAVVGGGVEIPLCEGESGGNTPKEERGTMAWDIRAAQPRPDDVKNVLRGDLLPKKHGKGAKSGGKKMLEGSKLGVPVLRFSGGGCAGLRGFPVV